MPLNLHLLRLFATVARTGSFSRAADALHISQPAISKSVRDFELQVGCRLLDRGPQGVKPTREGEALARHAAILFAAERAAEEELHAMRGLHQGALRIGASTTIATYMIPEYLGAFHRAHSNIELNIINANTQAIAEMMIGHEIDIALVEGVVEEPGLSSEPWRTDAMVLIAAPSHPLSLTEAPTSLESLAGETLIVREQGSGSLQVVSAALQARKISPARTLEVGGTEAIKQVVAAGLGVAIVSAATVKDQVQLGTLKIVPLIDFSIERTLWQVKKPGRIQSPAALAFQSLITRSDGT
jgi:DNA-binding transcriptional LysR family regulator